MAFWYFIHVVLQVVVSSVASFLVGKLWYYPSVFGRVWWRYQFPGKKFGECGPASSSLPLFLTAATLLVQECILTCVVNKLLVVVGSTGLQWFALPTYCAAALATVSVCASLPHYLFASTPLPVILLNTGHEALQISAAVFVIYLLAPISITA